MSMSAVLKPEDIQKATQETDQASAPYRTKVQYDLTHPKQRNEHRQHHQKWLASKLEANLYHYRQSLKRNKAAHTKGTGRYITKAEANIKWLREGTQVRARIIAGSDAQPTTLSLTKDEADDDDQLQYAIEDSHIAHEKQSTNRVVHNDKRRKPNVRLLNNHGLKRVQKVWARYAKMNSYIGNWNTLAYQKVVWLEYELRNCYAVQANYAKTGPSKTKLHGYQLYLPVFHSDRHSAEDIWRKLRFMTTKRLVKWYFQHDRHIALFVSPRVSK